MTDNYTPSTEEVRVSFYSSPGNRDWEAARLLAFDRWLSANNTAVRKKALKEAKEAATRPHQYGLGWESSVQAIDDLIRAAVTQTTEGEN